MISPGVFTKENDLSYLATGVANIGAAFIGPTLKGPAFRPITVTSQQDFVSLYGGTDPDYYTGFAIYNYLKQAAQATVVRVLGLTGYDETTVKSLLLSVSGSGGTYVVGLIHPSQAGYTLASASINAASSTQFTLVISGANGLTTFTSMSIDPNSSHYFAKILGSSPTTKHDGYSYVDFPQAAAFVSGALAGSGSMIVTQTTGELMLSGSTYGTYTNASTPMIRSQLYGSSRFDLFQAATLSDGNAANESVKISIASIHPDPTAQGYGSFSLMVRAFGDTDLNPSVLEQYDNLSMDPNSADYIAKRIGTEHTVIDANGDVYLDGDNANNSKYIYLIMPSGVENVPVDALPYAFAALATPVNTDHVPAPNYITSRYTTPVGATTPVSNNRVYYGFDFNDETGLSYLNPTPSGSVDSAGDVLRVGYYPSGSNEKPTGGVDVGFDLLTVPAAQDIIDMQPNSAWNIRKYTVPFQGGFDGQNPAVVRNTGDAIVPTNTMGFDLSDSTKDGARAYTQAIAAISNQDAYDINMLLMPGVIYSLHPYVAQQGIDLCETRGDAFYIMDACPLGSTVSAAVNAIQSIDSSYAGCYHPWVKILDDTTNKNIWVPPSVVMVGVFAFSDKTAAEWFAPAGLNRGGIETALAVRSRLAQEDRDNLYEGRVNPIAVFPAEGIVAWGQKTMQKRASALDRINVRRLLIALKKFIASTSRYLIFEQNVDSTRQRFLSVVNPYLASVQERSGLYAFKVVMDTTNNTPDIIDRNILVGDIFIKPTKTAEYINLTFNVLSTGAVISEG